MGKDPAETTQTTQAQPGSESAYQQALQQLGLWSSGGGPSYTGPTMTPYEQSTIEMYGQALPQLFGDQGLFGQAQGAIQHYLSPEYLNVTGEANWQNAMKMANQNVSQQFAGAGMGYSGLNAQEQNRATADLLLNEQGRREQLQSGLGRWGSQFPLEAAQGFMPMAGTEYNRSYAQWLQQAQQQQQAMQMLGQLGAGGLGSQTTQTTTPGGGPLDLFAQALQIYLMTQGIPTGGGWDKGGFSKV